jgi:hypothetical protein
MVCATQARSHRRRPVHHAAAGVLALAGMISQAAPALADDAPGATASPPLPPGQKPPCAPSTSYVLGYDCELFPLPSLAENPGGQPSGEPVATPAGAAEATASSRSSSGPSHAPAYVMFGFAGAGVVTAVTFGVLALKEKSTLSAECAGNGDCPASASSSVSALKMDGILADVGVGVAVAGVTLGAILFATERGHSSSSGRNVTPWLGLGAGGVRGTF